MSVRDPLERVEEIAQKFQDFKCQAPIVSIESDFI